MGNYGKKQNAGPYYSNGYRPNSRVSHKDFVVGEKVIYIGMNKNNHKSKLNNGDQGVVLEKKGRSTRSLILVQFSNSIRLVPKQLLQFPTDYTYCLEEQLTQCRPGVQSNRNQNKKLVRQKLQHKKYETILANRDKRREFRKWRQQFLDGLEENLVNEYKSLKESEIIKLGRVRESEIKKQIRLLKQKDELTDEETSQLEAYQAEVKQITRREKLHYQELRTLDQMVNNKASRQFVRCVYNRESYNHYLHCMKNNDDYPTFYKTLSKPSRTYSVETTSPSHTTEPIQRFQWGLS